MCVMSWYQADSRGWFEPSVDEVVIDVTSRDQLAKQFGVGAAMLVVDPRDVRVRAGRRGQAVVSPASCIAAGQLRPLAYPAVAAAWRPVHGVGQRAHQRFELCRRDHQHVARLDVLALGRDSAGSGAFATGLLVAVLGRCQGDPVTWLTG